MDTSRNERSGRRSSDQSDPIDDPFVSNLIKRKAKQLVNGPEFTTSDQVDIEQQLRLRLISQDGAYDPQRGHYRAFVTAVIERHAATIANHHRTKKRAISAQCSLSVIIGCDECGHPVELATTIVEDVHDLRLGRKSRSAKEQHELEQDVAALLAQLPQEERAICDRLMQDTIAQAARDLGIPPSTLYDKIRRVRERFEDASLRDYL